MLQRAESTLLRGRIMTGDAVTRCRKNVAESLLAVANSDGLICRHARYIDRFVIGAFIMV